MRRIVVISDVQMPFEDRRALRNVIDFVGRYRPDEVVQIGDLCDFPTPSRWTKGTAGEFEGSVFRDAEYARRNFLEPLRDVYAGPVKVLEGNHDERPRTYLERYAPALADTDAYNLEVLLDFDGFNVDIIRGWYDFAPGWTMAHGHQAVFSISQDAGTTARRALDKVGKSIVIGHTHRLAAVTKSAGYGGKSSTAYAIEVGHLMDLAKASYLKGGYANWQQGFAVLTVSGSRVTPQLVPIHRDGSFVVDGVEYRGPARRR